MSKKMSDVERKYPSYELTIVEALAVMKLEHWVGTRMKHVDTLSRIPVIMLPECYQNVTGHDIILRIKKAQDADRSSKFGSPNYIISDREASFTLTEFESQIKRINRIIIPVLAKMSLEESTNDNEEENQEKKEFEEGHKIQKLKGKTGLIIVNDQIMENNILDSRELLFLRKDNVAHFVDTNGRPLDLGSQKLFERNEMPCLGDLALGKAKVIKYKKHYHLALPVSEGQREGPTMTLTQTFAVIKDLRFVTENLKLETVSIAKTDYVNNVLWSNIKTALQLVIVDSTAKLITCNVLVKYPPKENIKSDVQRYIQQCLKIAEAFVDRFICVLEAPKAILTDQGRTFISELMKKIAKIFRIRKFRTTAFHPQSNGSLERSHHSLGEYLKQYADSSEPKDSLLFSLEYLEPPREDHNSEVFRAAQGANPSNASRGPTSPSLVAGTRDL
ncbi:POL4 protein, partial [Pseudoatta argentina]